jgi:hypothetical protein
LTNVGFEKFIIVTDSIKEDHTFACDESCEAGCCTITVTGKVKPSKITVASSLEIAVSIHFVFRL